MTYFNATVGGLSGAQGRYDTDYWLLSYRQAAHWLNQQARLQKDKPLRVLVAANGLSRFCIEPFLDKGIEASFVYRRRLPGQLPRQFDFYLATTRFGLDQNFPESPIKHGIGVDDVVFSVIRGHVNQD
jgi:hypothetical protein